MRIGVLTSGGDAPGMNAAIAGACQGLRAARVDALVVIGGDGSLRGARALADAGVHVAFIPATIDNDVRGTETTIGIDSAVNYAVRVIDHLRITGRSLLGERSSFKRSEGAPTSSRSPSPLLPASITSFSQDSRSNSNAWRPVSSAERIKATRSP